MKSNSHSMINTNHSFHIHIKVQHHLVINLSSCFHNNIHMYNLVSSVSALSHSTSCMPSKCYSHLLILLLLLLVNHELNTFNVPNLRCVFYCLDQRFSTGVPWRVLRSATGASKRAKKKWEKLRNKKIANINFSTVYLP